MLYIVADGTITVTDPNDANCKKKLVFKNNAPFISCNSKINNTTIDNAEDLEIVMQNVQFDWVQQKLFKEIRRFMELL